MNALSRPLILLALAGGLAHPLTAGDWELGGMFTSARELKASISTNGDYPAVPSAIVETGFTGAWLLGHVHAGYRAFHRQAWSVWIQAQVGQGLSHPELHHKGQVFTAGGSTAETFNGTATYTTAFAGLTVSKAYEIGEFSLGAGVRKHDLSVEGRRQTGAAGVFVYDTFRTSHSDQDLYVHLSFTALQDQGTYQSFQRITFGSGVNSNGPAVHPGPTDWRMSEGYLARTRPNSGVSLTLGVRL